MNFKFIDIATLFFGVSGWSRGRVGLSGNSIFNGKLSPFSKKKKKKKNPPTINDVINK